MNPREEIRAFVADTFFVETQGDADSFRQTGIVDSTGLLELVAFLEERFQVRIDEEDLVPQNLDSIDRICAYLERLLGTG